MLQTFYFFKLTLYAEFKFLFKTEQYIFVNSVFKNSTCACNKYFTQNLMRDQATVLPQDMVSEKIFIQFYE